MSKKESLIKQLFTNIKSWGWYQWVKYLLSGFWLGLVLLISFVILAGAFFDDEWIGFLFVSLFLIIPFVIAPMLGTTWLLVKNFRSPYVVFIILTFLATIMFLLGFHDESLLEFENVMFLVVCALIVFMSIICIRKINTIRKTKKPKELDSISTLSLFALWGITSLFLSGFVAGVFVNSDYEDYELKRYNECIETKIAKGYPKKFAREYCVVIDGCVEKEYEEGCEVGLKCCFGTIEEDKKWNYLDYDENGNRIKK